MNLLFQLMDECVVLRHVPAAHVDSEDYSMNDTILSLVTSMISLRPVSLFLMCPMPGPGIMKPMSLAGILLRIYRSPRLLSLKVTF